MTRYHHLKAVRASQRRQNVALAVIIAGILLSFFAFTFRADILRALPLAEVSEEAQERDFEPIRPLPDNYESWTGDNNPCVSPAQRKFFRDYANRKEQP